MGQAVPGRREGSWRVAKQTGSMQTWREGPESSRVRPVWGRERCFSSPEGVWHCRDKPPGPGPACHVAGPAGARAAGQGAVRHSPVPGEGTAGSSLDATLHRGTPAPKRTGKGLEREKHEPAFAGWIPELHLEGRCRSPFTGSHMLIQFTEQDEQPGIDCRLGNSLAKPRESLQQRGGTARAAEDSTAQGCPRRRLSHSVSQATRRQQGSREQRTEGLTQRRAS